MPAPLLAKSLERVAQTLGTSDVSDADLLSRYVAGSQDAFAALVRRHGPMVLGVCHRILPQQDVDDAFQATFLVLLRKARSIRPRSMLGNWLYGVAHQTAIRSRATLAKRRSREVLVAAPPERPVQDACSLDAAGVLDAELNRLPAPLRVAIVTCDLEGKTRKEAAQQLGWPEGTVAGRLARARALFAERLRRKGVALAGGTISAILTKDVSAVPPRLVDAVLTSAAGSVSMPVAALAKGVLTAMLLKKLKVGLFVLVVFALIGVGGAYLQTLAQGPLIGEPPQAEDRLGGLLMVQRELCRRQYLERKIALSQDRVMSGPHIHEVSMRLLQAELDWADHRKMDRMPVFQSHLERMQEIKRYYDSKTPGAVKVLDGVEVSYYVLDAEIRLEKARIK